MWRKLSLCPFPSIVSIPFNAAISGNIISRSPAISRILNPTDGLGERIILESSSLIRSLVMMLILSLFLLIASKVSGRILNPSCEANLIALIILRGSSEKVTSGSRGVLRILAFISSIPLKGSTSCPKESLLREIARAFTVKSRLIWSSWRVPSSTIGFLEFLL